MPCATPELQRAYQNEWIKNRRLAWIDENGPCVRCGSTLDLEVDHVDRSIKLYNAASLWSMSTKNPKRVAELAKCQVLCNLCHTGKTRSEFGKFEHGTPTMYNKHRCRCSICKEYQRLRFRAYRAALKQ